MCPWLSYFDCPQPLYPPVLMCLRMQSFMCFICQLRVSPCPSHDPSIIFPLSSPFPCSSPSPCASGISLFCVYPVALMP